MLHRIFLGLGSNIGERQKYLDEAITQAGKLLGSIEAVSSVYETEPWGFESSDKFLNMVVQLRSELNPSGLLGRIMMIESNIGRVRGGKNYTSRIIDIDILLFGNLIINEKALMVPHPKMAERRFVLVPLCEIAPGVVHPVLRKRISTLLKECSDSSNVGFYSKPLSAKLK